MRDEPNASRHGENLGFHNHKNKKPLRRSHRPQRACEVKPKICAQDLRRDTRYRAARRRSRVAILGRGQSFFRAPKILAPRRFFRFGHRSSGGKIGARVVFERIFVLGKSNVVARLRDTKTLRQTAVEKARALQFLKTREVTYRLKAEVESRKLPSSHK